MLPSVKTITRAPQAASIVRARGRVENKRRSGVQAIVTNRTNAGTLPEASDGLRGMLIRWKDSAWTSSNALLRVVRRTTARLQRRIPCHTDARQVSIVEKHRAPDALGGPGTRSPCLYNESPAQSCDRGDAEHRSGGAASHASGERGDPATEDDDWYPRDGHERGSMVKRSILLSKCDCGIVSNEVRLDLSRRKCTRCSDQFGVDSPQVARIRSPKHTPIVCASRRLNRGNWAVCATSGEKGGDCHREA